MGDDAPLWSPSPERAEATRLAAFRRRAGAPDYEALHAWSIERTRGVLAARVGRLRGRRGPGATVIAPRRALRRHPLLPRRAAVGRREPPAAARRRRSRRGRARGGRRDRQHGCRERGTSCVPTRPRPPRRSAFARRAAGRPRGHVAAERARGRDRDARRDVDRRGVLVDLTRLRHSRRARPLRSDRTGRAVRRRQLPLRRQALRLPRAARRDPGRPAHPAGDGRGGRRTLGHGGDGTTFLAPHRTSRVRPRAASRSTTRGTCSISSGTTGVPKCIVHRAGGVLLQHLKEHQLHCDIRRGDRVMYFTTTGWMMWNWLVSTLGVGRHRGALRRLAVPSRAERAVRHRRHGTAHAPRRVGEVHRLGRKGADPAGRPPTGSTPCARSARPARRSHPMGSAWSTSGSSPTCTSRRSRAAPTCAAAWWAAIPPDPCTRARSNDRCSAWPSTPRPTTDRRCATRRASPVSWSAANRFRRCRSGSGATRLTVRARSRGRAVPRRVLRAVPRGVGARRLRVVDRPRRHGHPRAERRHAQPGRRAHRHRRDLPRSSSRCPRCSRRSRSVSSGRTTSGSCCSFVSPTARRSPTTSSQRSGARVRTECSPRHVPAVVAAVDDLPRTRSNKLVELAVADAVHGRPVRNAEALANPEAIDAIVALPELAS